MLAKIYLSHSGTTSNKWTCPEWVKRLPGTTEPHESKWQMFWLQVTMLPVLIMTRVLYKQWTAVQWKARKTMQGNNAWWECINAMPTSFLVINDAVLFWRATCHYIWNQNKHITYACDLFGEMGGVYNLGCQHYWIWNWQEGNNLIIPVTDILIRLLEVEICTLKYGHHYTVVVQRKGHETRNVLFSSLAAKFI